MPPPPYRGLSPYTASDDDAELFFGRQAETEVVSANLLAARITILYGPSGVGKSSLLGAGLVHRLRRSTPGGAESGAARRAVVLIDEWSGDPLAEIVRQARNEVDEEHGAPEQRTSLAEELADLSASARVEFLLVLDQFEEHLLGHPAGGRLEVELSSLLEARALPVRVLISLREDALAGLDRFKETIPGLFDNYLRLDHLNRDAALEAIERPVECYNAHADRPVRLEPGLVDEVLDQLTADMSVGGRGVPTGGARAPSVQVEPAYLQLVMTRLWEVDATSHGVLRRATLEKLGGAGNIVGTHLHAAMDQLPARDQQLAFRVFHLLVTPSGMKVRHTASDLAEYLGEPEPDVERLLRELAQPQQRLLRAVTAPGGTSETVAYEIFHDVLSDAVLEWRTDHSARERRRLEVRSARLLTALAAVSVVALALAAYLWNPAPLRRLELLTVDQRFALRGAVAPSPDLLLVAVDDRTLRRLNAAGRGQITRTDYARLIERVNADRPRVIACDVIFQRPRGVRPDPAADRRLIRAVDRARDRIVLAFFGFSVERDPDGRSVLRPDLLERPNVAANDRLEGSAVADEGIAVGYSGLPEDPGPVLRRVDYRVVITRSIQPPTLAFRAAQIATGGSPSAQELPAARRRAWEGQSERTTWIDYRGGPRTVSTVSAVDVLEGRVAPGRFRGKLVVIGLTARDTKQDDRHRTSLGGEQRMAGPEIQANALDTIMRGASLRDAPLGIEALVIALLGLVAAAVSWLRSPARAAALVLITALFFLVAAQAAFEAGWIVSVVVPLGALVVASAAVLFVTLLGRRQRSPDAILRRVSS